ncbi:hypothetical protein ZWY2020_042338 [Hordeum vulgare]|nr:hypothetical protein ZWY2020_042338 [Hordeum vulgare]
MRLAVRCTCSIPGLCPTMADVIQMLAESSPPPDIRSAVEQRRHFHPPMRGEALNVLKVLAPTFGLVPYTMKKALEDKDEALADSQKVGREKIEAAEKKLTTAKFCQDFDKETEEIEPSLDPTKSPIGDVVAMDMFRHDARLKIVQGYIARLKAALVKIDKLLWPKDTLETDLESMMIRLNEILGRVHTWKKNLLAAELTWRFQSSGSIARRPRRIS